MKKQLLLTRMLLLVALLVGSVSYGWAETGTLISGLNSITSGDTYYIAALDNSKYYTVPNTTINGQTFTCTEGTYNSTTKKITPASGVGEFVFTAVAGKTNAYYIYNTNLKKYLVATGSKKFGYVESSSTDYGYWTFSVVAGGGFSGVFSVTHSSKTHYMRAYSNQVKCYDGASNNGVYFFKKDIETKTLSSIAVKTDFTTTEYKVGSAFSSAGLTLTATYDDSSTETISSGFTFKIGETALKDNDDLDETGDKTVTITYGGKTTTTSIYVGALAGIDVTTPPTKTTYNEGQTFDPTGMVVTATFSTGGSHADWTEVVNDYTYSPTAALVPANTSITISYTWNEDEETTTQYVTVNPGTAYTVTFDAGTGSCGTESLTEGSVGAGVTLPTATIGVTGWSFVGWATEATGNTEVAPTLYTAGSTYHPTDNCTLYAVYSFSDVSSTNYSQATTLDEITSASSIVIVNGTKVLDNTIGNVTAPSVTDGKMEPKAKDIFTLTGNNTDGFTLTNGTKRLGGASKSALTLATDASNYLWTFSKIGETTNFNIFNESISGEALEYYSGAWKMFTSGVTSYFQMKIYVPAEITVYNSNPAAIVNPTVAFTTAGDKALYLKNENEYDNAANVTGIDKTPVYTSSDATVATVSDAGVVTALKAGTTTITATVAAEVGVNTKASASYVVTVKTASNVAGLKAITDASSVVTFTADLTDAVVTYVDGNYAYIQDASGAVYASCGSSLTAGKKINGAISGSIKAAYKIDEITAINLDDATVTDDGIIPAAVVKTLAEIKAAGTDFDGKLVTVNGSKVTTALTDEQNGEITDDNGTTSFKLVCPYQGVNADKYAEGNITGFISIYNGSTYRLNVYDQSQIVLTKNAPTDQPLSFESNAVELDEDTPAFDDFTGQTVSGAIGDVTYSIKDGDDESGVVSSINASTGAVVLSGAYGTATITATAAAKEVTAAGVTTPYNETEKSYTVTVNPRYSVTFSVNGIETVLRQATSGATIAVPTPSNFGDYKFMGWSTSTVAPTDDEPSMTDLGATITPENNNGKYYAVFAKEKNVQTPGEITSTLTLNSGTVSSPYVNNGVTWTFSDLDFVPSGNGDMPNGSTVTFTLPVNATSTVSVNAPAASPWSTKNISIALTDANSTNIETFNNGISYTFTSGNNKSSAYTLTATNQNSKKAYMNTITVVYNGLVDDISYEDYRTSLPTVEVTISESKYLSFCYGSKLDFTETNVKAYKASVDGEGKVTLTKVDVVPAGEGVVLHCETSGTYAVPVTDASASDVTGNQMVGVLERTLVEWTTGGKYNYILQSGNFKKASDGYLKPNRAYLSTTYNVDAQGGAKPLTIVFNDDEQGEETDGIKAVSTKVENGVRYNLAGQKVGKDYKGIVIVNGKKMLNK